MTYEVHVWSLLEVLILILIYNNLHVLIVNSLVLRRAARVGREGEYKNMH